MLRVLFYLALIVTGTFAREAVAHEPDITCEARVIHATHGGGGVDPKIQRVRPYLGEPPFSSWNQFTLLTSKDFKIGKGGSDSLDLPQGRRAKITYVTPLHPPKGKERLRLRLTLTEGEKQLLDTIFVLDDEGVVMQAGQRYENGILILGISCDYPN